MKVVRILDQKGTILVSDALNQMILRKLVLSECSVSGLSKKLNIPTLKLWRKMQKLMEANLVELSRTEKVGNLEKKFYRASATTYIQKPLFELEPKDTDLHDAFDIYLGIQKEILAKLWAFQEIPEDADPIDFAWYATMESFVQVGGEPNIQTKITELKQRLADFQEHHNFQ
jgi:hypothetical protein